MKKNAKTKHLMKNVKNYDLKNNKDINNKNSGRGIENSSFKEKESVIIDAQETMREHSLSEFPKMELIDVDSPRKITTINNSAKSLMNSASKREKGQKDLMKEFDRDKFLASAKSEVIIFPKSELRQPSSKASDKQNAYVVNKYSLPKGFV
jgi:hypothetical protein